MRGPRATRLARERLPALGLAEAEIEEPSAKPPRLPTRTASTPRRSPISPRASKVRAPSLNDHIESSAELQLNSLFPLQALVEEIARAAIGLRRSVSTDHSLSAWDAAPRCRDSAGFRRFPIASVKRFRCDVPWPQRDGGPRRPLLESVAGAFRAWPPRRRAG